MNAITQFLNYAASNPDATVRYIRSDMVLHVESDASYLTAPKSRSRAEGYHNLSSRPTDPSKPPSANDPPPPGNGAISGKSSPALPKPNSPPYSTMVRRPAPSAPVSKKWAIPNRPRPS